MEVLSENRGGFVGIALDGTNVGVAVDMAEERILADVTKIPGGTFQVLWLQGLVGKRNDLVLQLVGPDFSHLVIRQVPAQVDAGHGRAAGGATWSHIDGHRLFLLFFS